MLKTRIISGIVLIGLIFWAIFSLPTTGFIIASGVLASGAMLEWLKLVNITTRWVRIITIDAFIVALFGLYWFEWLQLPLFIVVAFAWVFILPVLAMTQSHRHITKLNKPTLWVIGFVLLLGLFAGLTQLIQVSQGQYWVLMAFLLVWCADSFAYCAGRLVGKHKLISVVSPGKTWEGVLGGLILTLPALYAYYVYVLKQPIGSPIWYVIMAALIVFSVTGDLFESLVKRMHNVKDSGTLIPGHGGLLDRFDSLIAVAPLMALCHVVGWL